MGIDTQPIRHRLQSKRTEKRKAYYHSSGHQPTALVEPNNYVLKSSVSTLYSNPTNYNLIKMMSANTTSQQFTITIQ